MGFGIDYKQLEVSIAAPKSSRQSNSMFSTPTANPSLRFVSINCTWLLEMKETRIAPGKWKQCTTNVVLPRLNPLYVVDTGGGLYIPYTTSVPYSKLSTAHVSRHGHVINNLRTRCAAYGLVVTWWIVAKDAQGLLRESHASGLSLCLRVYYLGQHGCIRSWPQSCFYF